MNLYNNFSLIIGLCVTAVLGCSSCEREVEDRLPGNWNYAESGSNTVVYQGISNTEDINNTGTANFVDGGTGSITIGSTVTSLTWIVSNDTVQITKDGVSVNYFVITNDKTLQEWEAKHVESGDDFTFTTELNITLTQ